jgi:hypothetical protein
MRLGELKIAANEYPKSVPKMSREAIQVAVRVRPRIPLELDTHGPELSKEVRH